MQGLPPWVTRHLLADADFATAYGAQADWQLAALKTCLARLWILHPPSSGQLEIRREVRRQGFVTESRRAPRPWALVTLDGAFAAPARLLAGLVPLATAGIPQVFIVRVGQGDWPPALLAALELAGVETAAGLPGPGRLAELVQALEQSSGPGLVVGLSAGLEPPAACRSAFWRPQGSGEVAVWVENDLPWDWRVLAFAQAGCRITAYNAQRSRRGVRRRQGDWPTFLACGADLAAVPEALAEEALSSFPVVLAPGQEAVFAWPDFPRDLCLSHALAVLGAPS